MTELEKLKRAHDHLLTAIYTGPLTVPEKHELEELRLQIARLEREVQGEPQ